MKAHPVGAEEPSGKRLYKSPSTGEYISDAQYITEIVVGRKAKKDNVTLTYKYWNDKDNKYAKYFKSQITQAYKLLKKYEVKPIILALNKMLWCNSLFPGFFSKEVENQVRILDNKDRLSTNTEIVISEEKKIGSNNKTGKKSKFALLKEASNVTTSDSIPVRF